MRRINQTIKKILSIALILNLILSLGTPFSFINSVKAETKTLALLPGCKDKCHWADGGENWDCGGDWFGCCRRYARNKSICGGKAEKPSPPPEERGGAGRCRHGDYNTYCISDGIEAVEQCTRDGRWEFKYNQHNRNCKEENKGKHEENPHLTPKRDDVELPSTCQEGEHKTACAQKGQEDIWKCEGGQWVQKPRRINKNCQDETQRDIPNPHLPQEQDQSPEQTDVEREEARQVQDCQNYCHTDRGCTSEIGERSPGPGGIVYECTRVEGGAARWEPIIEEEKPPEPQPEPEKAKLTCRGNTLFYGDRRVGDCSPQVCKEREGCVEPPVQPINPPEEITEVPLSPVQKYTYSCSGDSLVAKISGQQKPTVVLNCPNGCDPKTNSCKELRTTTPSLTPIAELRYRCDQRYGRCVAGSKGPYSSLAVCEEACLPEPTPEPEIKKERWEERITPDLAAAYLENLKDPTKVSVLHTSMAHVLSDLDSDNDGLTDAQEALARGMGYNLDPYRNELEAVGPVEEMMYPEMITPETEYNQAKTALARAGLKDKDPAQWNRDDIKSYQRQLDYQKDPGRLLQIAAVPLPWVGAIGFAYADWKERHWAIEDAKEIDPDPISVAYGGITDAGGVYFLTNEEFTFVLDKAKKAETIQLPFPDEIEPNLIQIKKYLDLAYPGLTLPPDLLYADIETYTDEEILEKMGWDWRTLHNVKATIAGITEYRQGLQDTPEMQKVKQADTKFGMQQLINLTFDLALAGAFEVLKEPLSRVSSFVAAKLGQEAIEETVEAASKPLISEPVEEIVEDVAAKAEQWGLSESQITAYSRMFGMTPEEVLKMAERGQEVALRGGFANEAVVVSGESTAVKAMGEVIEEVEEAEEKVTAGRIEGWIERNLTDPDSTFSTLKEKASGLLNRLSGGRFGTSPESIAKLQLHRSEWAEMLGRQKALELEREAEELFEYFIQKKTGKTLASLSPNQINTDIALVKRLQRVPQFEIDATDPIGSKAKILELLGYHRANVSEAKNLLQAAQENLELLTETYFPELVFEPLQIIPEEERILIVGESLAQDIWDSIPVESRPLTRVPAGFVDPESGIVVINASQIEGKPQDLVETLLTHELALHKGELPGVYSELNQQVGEQLGRVIHESCVTWGEVEIAKLKGLNVETIQKFKSGIFLEGPKRVEGTLIPLLIEQGLSEKEAKGLVVRSFWEGYSDIAEKVGGWEKLGEIFRDLRSSANSSVNRLLSIIPRFLELASPVHAAESNRNIPIHPLLYKRILMIEELDRKITQNPDLSLEEALVVIDKYEYIKPEARKEGNQVILTTGEDGTATVPLTTGAYQVTVEPIEKVNIITPLSVKVSVQTGGLLKIGLQEGEGNIGLPTKESFFGKLLGWAREAYAQEGEVLAAATRETSDGNLVLVLFHDVNGNGVQDAGEEDLSWAGVTTTLTKTTSDYTYEFLEGWNFISIPVVSETVKTASNLITDVAAQGGYVTTVARWKDGKWEEFIQRGQQRFGQDFPIEPGVAYMLRNHVHLAKWTISGHELTTPLPLELGSGFNGIGIPYSEKAHTASTILDDINLAKSDTLTPETENADLVGRFVSGNWDVFVKRIYSEEKIERYGHNFPIEKTEGYFIKVKEDVTWTP